MYVHTGHRSHKHNLLSPSHAVPSLSSVPRHSLQSNMSTHVKVFLFMPLVVVAFPAIESSRFEYPRTVLCRSQGGGQVCIWRGNVFILFFNLYDKTKWKTLFECKHVFLVLSHDDKQRLFSNLGCNFCNLPWTFNPAVLFSGRIRWTCPVSGAGKHT